MRINKKSCFKHLNGEDIYLFTLSNANGTEVCITNYGGIITSFKIKMTHGAFNDIVLGFDRVEDYLAKKYLNQYPYLGAVCGRYANRIKNGLFSIDARPDDPVGRGTKYQVTQNMGNDQLHGGYEGFDKKTWQVINDSDTLLEFKYISKDGEEGFPGNLETTIRFSLSDDDELTYEFLAVTDKATAVNLTHHGYFNLNNGKGTIEDHEVKIYASNILAQDEGLVCNGEFIEVENTIYDFRDFKKINYNWNSANGYDQCFEIDNKDNELSLMAEARSLESGITLQIFSTEPAVQFYTSQGLGKIVGKKGTEYGPFSGLCLETQTHPNAINIPHFPNTVLRPGEIYEQKNVYKIIQTAVSK